jgi:hypothetical protein
MNIVDMVIGFVGGGAIGGGALYALQQGKIAELTKQFQKTRSALNETESELKDTKGQLKLLDVSEARIRDIEGTYREEVAKLQVELDEAKAKLQETVLPVVSPDWEAEYQARIQEIQQDYENQLLELRQTHQSQSQELETLVETPVWEESTPFSSEFTSESEVPENLLEIGEFTSEPEVPESLLGAEPWDELSDTPRTDFSETLVETPVWEESTPFSSEFTSEPEVPESLLGAEPWDDLSDSPRADFSETLVETPVWEESTPFSSEFTSEPEVPENLLEIDESTSEPEMFNGITPMEELPGEMEMPESLTGFEESTSELEMFNGITPMEELPGEMEMPESLTGFEESTSELEMFNGITPMEELPGEMEMPESLTGFEESTEESTSELEMFNGVTPMEESLSELEIPESWMEREAMLSEIEAIDSMPTIAEPPILGHEFDFLDRPSSEEAIESISSLEDLAIEEEEVLIAPISYSDTNFYDLFPTEAEQAETSVTGEIPLSIDDLFGDSSELSSLDTPKAETNGHEELDLDFLNMLEDSETGSINSLSSDEDLESSFDELFSDDLFSDWSSGTPDHASKIESH